MCGMQSAKRFPACECATVSFAGCRWNTGHLVGITGCPSPEAAIQLTCSTCSACRADHGLKRRAAYCSATFLSGVDLQKILLNISAAIIISLILITANVWYRQQRLYSEGLAGEKAGNFMEAVTGYESAIRMYLPFSPTVDKSAQQIWAMGETAEKKGNIEHALIAYRSLRSSFYAVQWLKQPGKEWIRRCDMKIAALAPLRKRVSQ